MNSKIGVLFKGDKVIWMVFFFLCIISITEVFSASSTLTYKNANYFSPVVKHSGLLFVGLIAMVVTLNIKCKYFKIVTPFMLLLSYMMLVWVLFAPKVNDAGRWISLLGIQFQPSEIAKGTMVLLTAQILSNTQTPEGADKRAFWWIAAVCAPMILLIFPENFSTAALISLSIFIMMVVGRVPSKQLAGLMATAVVAVAFFLLVIFTLGDTNKVSIPEEDTIEQVEVNGAAESVGQKGSRGGFLHRLDLWKQRIMDFANHEEVAPEDVDIKGKGAQVAYSRIAIASSHVVGVGPGNSVERDFLSQAFSDFIFAIIIEEMGLWGAFIVAFLYIVLLFRAGMIAKKCENNFPAFLVMGLAVMLVTQALFNMCVAVGLAPVTGQPLPLISKGGTSSIINCIYIGVILSVSRTAKKRGDVSVGKKARVTN